MGQTDLSGRYCRNFNSLSMADQRTLAASTVAIIGLGGLGGGVCEILARTGVGHLIVVDGDLFEASNLNRQLLCREDLIGTSKARAAENRIRRINSDVKVTCVPRFLDGAAMPGCIRDADVVVDCLDTISARFDLQSAAQGARIPIVSGAIAGMTGQVTTIFPRDKGYELIYGKKEAAGRTGAELQTGNLACCALYVASLQSSECIKVLTRKGCVLRNRLLISDLLTNDTQIVVLDDP